MEAIYIIVSNYRINQYSNIQQHRNTHDLVLVLNTNSSGCISTNLETCSNEDDDEIICFVLQHSLPELDCHEDCIQNGG